MIEFNPDGSLKLPEHLQRSKDEKENRLRSQRCVQVRKEVVSVRPPKQCALHLLLSEAFSDAGFVDRIYSFWNKGIETPAKIKMLGEREFDIEIGTSFRRCSECNTLISRLREHLDGNLILEKGNCTFEPRQFEYEDYFD